MSRMEFQLSCRLHSKWQKKVMTSFCLLIFPDYNLLGGGGVKCVNVVEHEVLWMTKGEMGCSWSIAHRRGRFLPLLQSRWEQALLIALGY